eukprot:288631-Pyramimonas_sp.AAC.1
MFETSGAGAECFLLEGQYLRGLECTRGSQRSIVFNSVDVRGGYAICELMQVDGEGCSGWRLLAVIPNGYLVRRVMVALGCSPGWCVGERG